MLATQQLPTARTATAWICVCYFIKLLQIFSFILLQKEIYLPGSQHLLHTLSTPSRLFCPQNTHQPTIRLNDNNVLLKKGLKTFVHCSHMTTRLKQQSTQQPTLAYCSSILFVPKETVTQSGELVLSQPVAPGVAAPGSVWHSICCCSQYQQSCRCCKDQMKKALLYQEQFILQFLSFPHLVLILNLPCKGS